MSFRNYLSLAREVILNPNKQPLAEFNDVLEENDIPKVEAQYVWVSFYETNEDYRPQQYRSISDFVGIYSSLHDAEKSVYDFWDTVECPDYFLKIKHKKNLEYYTLQLRVHGETEPGRWGTYYIFKVKTNDSTTIKSINIEEFCNGRH